jgi:hypothetical protein
VRRVDRLGGIGPTAVERLLVGVGEQLGEKGGRVGLEPQQQRVEQDLALLVGEGGEIGNFDHTVDADAAVFELVVRFGRFEAGNSRRAFVLHDLHIDSLGPGAPGTIDRLGGRRSGFVLDHSAAASSSAWISARGLRGEGRFGSRPSRDSVLIKQFDHAM